MVSHAKVPGDGKLRSEAQALGRSVTVNLMAVCSGVLKKLPEPVVLKALPPLRRDVESLYDLVILKSKKVKRNQSIVCSREQIDTMTGCVNTIMELDCSTYPGLVSAFAEGGFIVTTLKAVRYEMLEANKTQSGKSCHARK